VNAGYSYSTARRRSGKASRGSYTPGRPQRRGGLATIVAIALAGLALWVILPRLDPGVRDLGLPLKDSAVIRQQAGEKHLDPALIAAVIYAETKFEPRTSSAGALGLMQILPSTARFLAGLSGGTSFRTSDLATPQINVAYGSYYLRYLLDHYQGDELEAIAAYNAGLSNVDEWVAGAQAHQLSISEIPFPETRAYVQRVMAAQGAYRTIYAHQLGLG
jgi:soluble lytic murein transglycosylase